MIKNRKQSIEDLCNEAIAIQKAKLNRPLWFLFWFAMGGLSGFVVGVMLPGVK